MAISAGKGRKVMPRLRGKGCYGQFMLAEVKGGVGAMIAGPVHTELQEEL